MNPPIPLEQGWERLLAMLAPLPAERVPTGEAIGRTLAQPLIARRTQPHADLSAMDGFACAGKGPWTIVGEARAGAGFDGRIEHGEAVRISTGAAIPAGGDRIVIVEEARVDADRLETDAPATPGRHIRRRGFDFAEGDRLLETGERVGPATLALALAAGVGRLAVHRRPVVAIVECGDELVADPDNCPPDRLPASNGAMLEAMVRQAGGLVHRIGPVADRAEAVRDALECGADADLIVTSGGASVGAHDLVKPVLEEMGAEIDLWRVAMRPGKPLLIARLSGRTVLGLPGNPVSSFVTGLLFALPAMRALSGSRHPLPESMPMVLGQPLPEGGARREFRRAILSDGRACPLDERDSSALLSLAKADLLIDRPAGAVAAEAGDIVPCYWLGNGALS